MSYTEKYQELMAFIQDTFDEGDLARGLDDDVDIEMEYEKFIGQQRRCLESLAERELDHLLAIKGMIEKTRIFIMDKESMCQFTASGFFFNKGGKLVMFNER